MRQIVLLLGVAPFVLGGCGAFVPIQNPETLRPEVLETAKKIEVLSGKDSSELKQLGEVVGYSCKNKLWDPDATIDDATLQLKLAAVQRGATAILVPNCSAGSVSFGKNCWNSYTCKAMAFSAK